MAITSDLLAQLAQIMRPMKMRVANMIARAIVNLADDSGPLRLLQMNALAVGPEATDREVIEDGEHFQEYGFFSIPNAGAEAVVIFPNGDRGHPLVIAVADRRTRPAGGQGGEAGLYTDEGDEIRLARGHLIVLTTSGEIRAGSAAASVPVALSSEVAALKLAIAAFIPSTGDGAALKAIFAAWAAPGAAKLKAE